jgi:hypothetical protein
MLLAVAAWCVGLQVGVVRDGNEGNRPRHRKPAIKQPHPEWTIFNNKHVYAGQTE